MLNWVAVLGSTGPALQAQASASTSGLIDQVKYNISSSKIKNYFLIKVIINSSLDEKEHWQILPADQSEILGNCPPTLPLTQNFALKGLCHDITKLWLMLD